MESNEIEGYELLDKYNINALMALKLGKRVHNQDILEGKLYLNTVEYFRSLEEEKQTARGIGDKDDSCFVLHKGSVAVYGEKGEPEFKFNFNKGVYKTCGDKYLFCLYIMNRDNIKRVYVEEDSQTLFVEARFTERQKLDIRRLFSNPESVLFILNEKDFIGYLTEAVQAKGGKCEMKQVEYRDNCHPTPDYVNSFENRAESMAFYKDRYFAPEHEYRVLFDPLDLRDGHYLDCKKVNSNIFLLDIEQALNGRFIIKYAISMK